MVKRVQEFEDFYNLDEDEDDEYLFYAPTTRFDIDEQLVIVACLMLLEQRYRVLKSMSPQRIVEEVEDIIDSLNVELTDTALDKIDSATRKFFDGIMSDYNIPDKYVSIDTSMYPIVDESITTLCNQLKGELKQKSMFFKDNLTKDSFNILPNFKRAVQKVIDASSMSILMI